MANVQTMQMYNLVEFFSQDDAIRLQMYIPRPSWWVNYEFHQFLDVATPPRLAYIGSANTDSSYFACTVWTIAVAVFAAMAAHVSFQTASKGVKCPRRSKCSPVLAYALYPVWRIFRMLIQLVEIVLGKVGVGNNVKDIPYSVQDLTAILNATENHHRRADQAWAV